MTQLDDEQQQLLLDYALGMAGPEQIPHAEALLSSDPHAAELHGLFKSAISPLDTLAPEPCPDDLAERTIKLLKAQAQADPGTDQAVERLISASAPATTIKVPFWRNWTEVFTAAAAIILFIGVLLPTLGAARQRHYRMRCQNSLAGIHEGLVNYVADHDGLLPAVAMKPGSPWWKVGDQGPENVSNTRRGWVLVQNGYVQASSFTCAGRRVPRKPDFANLNVAGRNDFPDRLYIHFSIRIQCPSADAPCLDQKRVLMADMNPLSELLPSDHSGPLTIELCKELMSANSRNHGGHGQNLLISDGSVEYARRRQSRISDDDIYTLQAMSCGSQVRGTELPACEKDTFLAP